MYFLSQVEAQFSKTKKLDLFSPPTCFPIPPTALTTSGKPASSSSPAAQQHWFSLWEQIIYCLIRRKYTITFWGEGYMESREGWKGDQDLALSASTRSYQTVGYLSRGLPTSHTSILYLCAHCLFHSLTAAVKMKLCTLSCSEANVRFSTWNEL